MDLGSIHCAHNNHNISLDNYNIHHTTQCLFVVQTDIPPEHLHLQMRQRRARHRRLRLKSYVFEQAITAHEMVAVVACLPVAKW